MQSALANHLILQAKVVVAAAAAVDEIDEEETGPAEANYEYLLSMSIQSLTLEKVSDYPSEQLMFDSAQRYGEGGSPAISPGQRLEDRSHTLDLPLKFDLSSVG